MPLPKSLTQPLRQGQLTVGNGYRAYFAPFNQQLAVSQTSTSIGPTIYDLEVLGKFVDSPTTLPVGWFDLGLVDKVKVTPGSKIGNVVTGYRGAVRAKYRGEVAEKCSFVFREMSRMALSIAAGCQVFNLLNSSAAANTTSPLGSSGNTAVAISSYAASGAVAGYLGQPTLTLASPPSSGQFVVGSFIVCDQDYNNTTFGYVGDAGANVFQGAVTDVDFIRKTSDYVATVAAVSGSNLILTKPFIGGGNSAQAPPNVFPTAGAKVQPVQGFAARSGGTYIREWSAIFINDTIDASQVLIYYPRLAPDQFTGLDEAAIQNISSLKEFQLNASYEAMAFDDPLDGETVVGYMAYYPHPGVTLQA